MIKYVVMTEKRSSSPYVYKRHSCSEKKFERDRRATVMVSLLCKIVGPKFARAVCCEFCEAVDSQIIRMII